MGGFVLGGHYGVRVVASDKHVDAGGGRVEAEPRAIDNHPGRGERAVFVHADELHAVVGFRGHEGVRAVAHVKRADRLGLFQCQGQGVAEPACRPQRAVFVHADELHAVVVVPGHDGVRAASGSLERVYAAGALQRQIGVVDPAQRVGRRQRAVFVHADQLHGVIRRGYYGVGAVAGCAAAAVAGHLEHVHAPGAFQCQCAFVGQGAGLHERTGVGLAERVRALKAAAVHADQLHATFVAPMARRGKDVHGAVHGKYVDAERTVERIEAAYAVFRPSPRREGAAAVHKDQLHAVFAPRRRGDVRGVAHGERIDIEEFSKAGRALFVPDHAGGGQRAAVARAEQHHSAATSKGGSSTGAVLSRCDGGVRGAAQLKGHHAVGCPTAKARGGGNHGRLVPVHLDACQGGQRAVRPRGWQGQVCGVAGGIADRRRAASQGERIFRIF